MDIYEEIYNEVNTKLKDLVNTIRHKDRFPNQHDFLKLIDENLSILPLELEENDKIYRARIYEEESLEDNYPRKFGFEGYNAVDSYAPPKAQARAGRINPSGISYLYAAKDEYTTILEVQPRLFTNVSIAEIIVKKKLKLCSLINQEVKIFNDIYGNSKIEIISKILCREFSRTYNNKEESYLITQFLASYLQKKGYDGIAYTSSLNPAGINYCIFDTSMCEAINSNVVSVNCIELLYHKKNDLVSGGGPKLLQWLENLKNKDNNETKV